MSDLIDKEKQLFELGRKGMLEEVGAMPHGHDQADQNPNSEKSKKKKEQELNQLLSELNDTYNNLINQLNDDLEITRDIIEQLENDMNANRSQFENHVETLNDIDDVFCDLDHGEGLDRQKAKAICNKNGINIPENTSDADMIALLNLLRVDLLEDVEKLDNDYLVMDENLNKFKAQEQDIQNNIAKAEQIYHSDMSEQEKQQALENIANDSHSKTLHAVAPKAEEHELAAKLDDTIKKVEIENLNSTYSKPLVFPGMN